MFLYPTHLRQPAMCRGLFSGLQSMNSFKTSYNAPAAASVREIVLVCNLGNSYKGTSAVLAPGFVEGRPDRLLKFWQMD